MWDSVGFGFRIRHMPKLGRHVLIQVRQITSRPCKRPKHCFLTVSAVKLIQTLVPSRYHCHLRCCSVVLPLVSKLTTSLEKSGDYG